MFRASLVRTFQCFRHIPFEKPKTSRLLPSYLYFVRCFCSQHSPSNSVLKYFYFPLSCPPFCFVGLSRLSCQSISTFCTQFQFFALNFNFLHCLGLIDVLSANQHDESFACILLHTELLPQMWHEIASRQVIVSLFWLYLQCSCIFTVKLSKAYPSILHYWTDYLKLEPASRFKNAIMNWLFQHWTRSLDPRIRLTASIFEKSIHCCD